MVDQSPADGVEADVSWLTVDLLQLNVSCHWCINVGRVCSRTSKTLCYATGGCLGSLHAGRQSRPFTASVLVPGIVPYFGSCDKWRGNQPSVTRTIAYFVPCSLLTLFLATARIVWPLLLNKVYALYSFGWSMLLGQALNYLYIHDLFLCGISNLLSRLVIDEGFQVVRCNGEDLGLGQHTYYRQFRIEA